MLNRIAIILPLCFATIASADPSSAGTYELGYVPVPGACASSDYPSRSPLPWKEKPNIIANDGRYMLSLLVIPSEAMAEQPAEEQKLVESCVQDSVKSLDRTEAVLSNPDVPEQLTERINACLKRQQSAVSVRFSTFQRGRIECAASQQEQ